MAAWEAQQAEWQQQARHLAAAANKSTDRLALTTGEGLQPWLEPAPK